MSRLAAQAEREADEHAKTQALIIEAYKANQSLRDISKVTGISHEGIRRILAKNRVPIRGRGRAKSTPAPES